MRNGRDKRRVVITGMGVIAPNGQTLDTFWESLRTGKSPAGPVTRFDTRSMPSHTAAEIPDFRIEKFLTSKKGKRLNLSLQFGIAAAMLAVENARLEIAKYDPDRVGIIEATSVSTMETYLKGNPGFEAKGYRGLSPFTLINAYSGGGSGEIALELGIRGHALTYSSGSASGSDVIGYALRMIRDDEVDVMVAGGAEAPILAPLYGGFCLAKVMVRGDRTDAMRPFDQDRDGFLLGEGGGYLVLEELGHALARGAYIYAEVAGHGRSVEAYHSVAPHPEGLGLKRALEKALRDADVIPEEVEYINAHGTATEANDRAETQAIKTFFGAHASRIAVTSTKPITGHLLAAAGALETAVCALAIDRQEIPMTANSTVPDRGCDLNYLFGKSLPYPLRVVANCSVGFGGKNSCLILKRYQDS